MYNDYEWCAENIISQKNTLQGIPLAMIDRWIPYFKNDKCVIIENLEEIKEISLEEVRDCLDETMKIVISNYKRTEIPETFLPYEAWIAEKIG